MISGRSIMLSGYNIIENATKVCDNIGCALDISEASLAVTPTITASTSTFLYMEKVENEHLTSRITPAQISALKNVVMETTAAALAATSSDISSTFSDDNYNNNNNINNHNSSNCSINHSKIGYSNNNVRNYHCSNGTLIGQQSSQTGQNSHCNISNNVYTSLLSCNPLSVHLASNYVKRERSSPNTNGDFQSTLLRSHSSTPSSFHGTSPQQSIHSSPSDIVIPTHNLAPNLLNSIHQITTSASRNSEIANLSPATMILQQPSETVTRHYSNFMRSLAAKYNNSISNECSPKKTISERTIGSALNVPSIELARSLNRTIAHSTSQSLPATIISPIETITIKQTQPSQPNSTNTPTTDADFSPFIATLLSNFNQNCFSPLIDMSSTQALITLARVAKENEIHNVLHSVQNLKHSTATSASNITLTRNVNVALQQAMQFATPALMYSTQKHKSNSRQSSPSLAQSFEMTANASSPHIVDEATSGNIVVNKSNINPMPLDLSSQPPLSKRFKTDLTINQRKNVSSMTNWRASTSTTSNTPSPPLSQNLKRSLLDSSLSSSSTLAAFTLPDEKQNLKSNSARITATTITTTTVHSPAMIGGVCHAQSDEVNSWSVEDVCSFVGNIDICAEYIQHFRDQRIDGSGLPLLTEDHLINTLGLKLGPALKLRLALSKKLGGLCPCVACMSQAQHVPSGTCNETLITNLPTQIPPATTPTATTISRVAADIIAHSGYMTTSSTANNSISRCDDNDDTNSSNDTATAVQCTKNSNKVHNLRKNSTHNNNGNSNNTNIDKSNKNSNYDICGSGNCISSGSNMSVPVVGVYCRQYTGNGSNINNCNSTNLSPKHNDFTNSTDSNNHNNSGDCISIANAEFSS